MTPAEYAAHRKAKRLPGGTERAVRKALTDGRITAPTGKIDPAVADRQWRENTTPGHGGVRFGSGRPRGRAPAVVTGGDGLSYSEARRQREIVRLRREEHELAVLHGKFYEKTAQDREVANLCRTVRSTIRAVPSRAGMRLNLTREQIETLREEIDLALTCLGDMKPYPPADAESLSPML